MGRITFEKFTTAATILGFIVDAIAMISILLAINTDFSTSKLATPWLAFSIWILAVFTYFGFLQQHWRLKKNEEKYSANFRRFLTHDLLKNFRNPWALLPGLILLIIFFWIVTQDGSIIGALFIGALIGGLIWLFTSITMSTTSKYDETPIFSEHTKAIIDESWEELRGRIAMELSKRGVVDAKKLRDLGVMKDISSIEELRYALIKFAWHYPDSTEYDYIMEYLRYRNRKQS